MMSELGQSRRFPDVCEMSGLLVIPDKPFSGAFMSSRPSFGPKRQAHPRSLILDSFGVPISL
jgi:hypothetical protein